MPEKVWVWENHQVIQIDSYGEVTLEDLRKSFQEVAALRAEHGITKVLVDASKLKRLPSTFRSFEFGTEMADAFRDTLFATIASDEAMEDLVFLQTVVKNRGVQLEIFETRDAALSWLNVSLARETTDRSPTRPKRQAPSSLREFPALPP